VLSVFSSTAVPRQNFIRAKNGEISVVKAWIRSALLRQSTETAGLVPVAHAAHTHIYKDGPRVGRVGRTRQPDGYGGEGLTIAPEKAPDLKLPNESCRSVFPSRVRDACGPHGSSRKLPTRSARLHYRGE
jgi:hypothetical protein